MKSACTVQPKTTHMNTTQKPNPAPSIVLIFTPVTPPPQTHLDKARPQCRATSSRPRGRYGSRRGIGDISTDFAVFERPLRVDTSDELVLQELDSGRTVFRVEG